jgi:integrase
LVRERENVKCGLKFSNNKTRTGRVMPKLTVAAIEKYVADKTKRREIRDTLGPGLHLIIQPKPKGSKSWALRFRRPDGRSAKLTLGKVDLSDESKVKDEPVIGGTLTLPQARELAAQIDRRRARGEDVIAAEKAKATRDAASATAAAINTFGAAAREFFGDHRTKWNALPRRWHEAARIIGLDWPLGTDDPAKVEPTIILGSLAATWADKVVATIDDHDIHSVVDTARKSGIPGMRRANRGTSDARGRKMHAALSAIFKWLLQNRRISSNPTAGVYCPGAPPPRERVLTDAEIVKFWNAADKADAPYGAIFKMLLLTGCRLNEVAGMRREELSDDSWTIPSERTKNHRPLVLALPPLALALIDSDGTYVFSSGDKPVTSFSRMKKVLDEAIGKGVPPWRLHDLRRTAATGMAELGIAPHIIEAVLNHVSGAKAGVAGIYNRAVYAPEKKAALERWAAHIDGLVTGKAANVTAMRRHSKPQRY